MRRLLVIVTLLFAILSVSVAAEDLYPCQQYVNRYEVVTLRAWYLHEWPAGERYRDDHTYTALWDDVIASAHGEGTPVAFQWFIDGELVKTCGEVPPPWNEIFNDGFDSGDTSQWG